jgi:AraC-like DNA-binding protein
LGEHYLHCRKQALGDNRIGGVDIQSPGTAETAKDRVRKALTMNVKRALEATRIWRPPALPETVEVVDAGATLRHFPPRLSTTLGICRKSTEAHLATSDGERLEFPADAVILRPPDCIWSSAPTRAAFVSVDVATSLLPTDARFKRMRWVHPMQLREFDRALHILRNAHSRLAADAAVAGLIQAVARQDFFSSEEIATAVAAPSLRERANEYLRAHVHRNVQLAELATACDTNVYVLLRRFRECFGMTPHAFHLQVRIAKARRLLAGGTSPVDVAALTGFADQSHLGRRFKTIVGVSPGEYARQVRPFVVP